MDDQQVDVAELRRRFPWFGLASIEEPDLSVRYREILAEASQNREIVEAVRRGA
ncbi:hypothetical protein GCM10029976_087990 [Kribbella albertanoniae]|uniref:hypothetical protein n=1 Tax=Kribbella albertanoniae TaxID=1266829 RepID=UPI00140464F4|nr:hypothetical protein [Kribbella albertanoniae]